MRISSVVPPVDRASLHREAASDIGQGDTKVRFELIQCTSIGTGWNIRDFDDHSFGAGQPGTDYVSGFFAQAKFRRTIAGVPAEQFCQEVENSMWRRKGCEAAEIL
jgi:hypothetical protein